MLRAYGATIQGTNPAGITDIEFRDIASAAAWAASTGQADRTRLRDPIQRLTGLCVVQVHPARRLAADTAPSQRRRTTAPSSAPWPSCPAATRPPSTAAGKLDALAAEARAILGLPEDRMPGTENPP